MMVLTSHCDYIRRIHPYLLRIIVVCDRKRHLVVGSVGNTILHLAMKKKMKRSGDLERNETSNH